MTEKLSNRQPTRVLDKLIFTKLVMQSLLGTDLAELILLYGIVVSIRSMLCLLNNLFEKLMIKIGRLLNGF